MRQNGYGCVNTCSAHINENITIVFVIIVLIWSVYILTKTQQKFRKIFVNIFTDCINENIIMFSL